MKKIFTITALLILVTGSLFARQGVTHFGLRAGAAVGFNTSAGLDKLFLSEINNDPTMAFPAAVTTNRKVNFNFAFYYNYGISDNLSVQWEGSFMINQGYELEFSAFGISAATVDITYSSMDIPLLLRYNFLQSTRTLGIQAGPHISVPIGKAKMEGMGESEEERIYTPATFGFTAGLVGGVPAGRGRVIADARYIFDFSKLEILDEGEKGAFMQRRALVFTIGYEFAVPGRRRR